MLSRVKGRCLSTTRETPNNNNDTIITISAGTICSRGMRVHGLSRPHVCMTSVRSVSSSASQPHPAHWGSFNDLIYSINVPLIAVLCLTSVIMNQRVTFHPLNI